MPLLRPKVNPESANTRAATRAVVAAPPFRPHLAYLDGLRALAALYVVLNHVYLVKWDILHKHYPPGWANLLTRWMIYGHFAVSVFIVLSGFCLMLPMAPGEPILRGGAKTFFRRRARRILPPYYGAIVLALLIPLLLGTLGGTAARQNPVTLRDIVTHLLLVHNLRPETLNSINGAFWSIAVECQIYLLFPLLVLLWRRWGGIPTTLLAVVLAYAASYRIMRTGYFGLTPHYVALFALGMAGAVLAYAPSCERIRARVPWLPFAAVLTLLTVLLCYHWDWEVTLFHRVDRPDLLIGLATVSVLVAASRSGANRLRDLLSVRPLTRIGQFSYSLYLTHVPLIGLLWTLELRLFHLSGAMAWPLLVCIGIPLLVGGAYLFYLACERPWLSRSAREASFARAAKDKREGSDPTSETLASVAVRTGGEVDGDAYRT